METRRARVLVIDDEAPLLRMMKRALGDEHDVLALTSASEALERIRQGERFDLVLCDLMLPGMSGVDFYEQIDGSAPELLEAIVFMTGGAHTPRAEAFLRRDGVRHIDKPFGSLAELREMVGRHTRSAQSNPRAGAVDDDLS